MKHRLLITGVAVAGLAASTALAAGSQFNGVYKGKTSQGHGISFTVQIPPKKKYGNDLNGKVTLRYKCATSPPRTYRGSTFFARVSSTGKISGLVAGGDDGYNLHISGSIKGKRATGSMRASFYAKASKTGKLSDQCKTGTVTFSAVR